MHRPHSEAQLLSTLTRLQLVRNGSTVQRSCCVYLSECSLCQVESSASVETGCMFKRIYSRPNAYHVTDKKIKSAFTGLNDVSVYNEPSELKPNNPFLVKQKENNILDIAMEVLQTITYRKSSSK